MKVIAQTKDSTYSRSFLVEMSDSEIERITGQQFRSGNKISIGDKFDVFSAWDRMARTKAATEEALDIAKKLRAYATLIEGTVPELSKSQGLEE